MSDRLVAVPQNVGGPVVRRLRRGELRPDASTMYGVLVKGCRTGGTPLGRGGGDIKWYAKTGVDHGIPSDVM